MLGRAKSGETSIKRAALINMCSRYTAAFVGLAYSVILARILTPDDFGVVAIAQVFVTFFALFQDMGLGSAIIQRQDLETEDVSRLFGFSVLLAIVLGLALCVAGVPISMVYTEPRLVGICAALSATTFFSTLNTVPNALLMKSRRFVVVGIRQVTSTLLASALGIVSAALGAGPYAIVVYSVSGALINFAWNYATNSVRPMFRGMMESVKKVFGYSAYLFGFNLITYFSRNTDNLLVGYFFGSADLGNYSKAYQLMRYPQTYLTGVITGVVHPMLAEKQKDVDYIYDVYIRLSKALSLVGVFFSVFCFFSANEIVSVLYGERWASSAICLRYLSVSIWSQMVCGASGPIFQVLGRTKEQFIRGVLVSVVTIGATLVGVASGGIEGVALYVGLAYFAPFVLLLPLLIRMSFGRSEVQFLKVFAPDALIAGVMCVTLAIVGGVIHFGDLGTLVVKLLASLIAYIAALVALGQARWLASFLPKSIRARMPKRLLS
jgi:PST family polysaccharide transporter